MAERTSFSSLEELMDFNSIFSNTSIDQKALFSSSRRIGKGKERLNLDSNPIISTLHPFDSEYSRANCHAMLVLPDDFGPNRMRLLHSFKRIEKESQLGRRVQIL